MQFIDMNEKEMKLEKEFGMRMTEAVKKGAYHRHIVICSPFLLFWKNPPLEYVPRFLLHSFTNPIYHIPPIIL